MDFLKNITDTITDVKDYVVEKNKRSTLIAKLRSTVRNEKIRADKAYIALGRYYYHNLRDELNLATEPYCTEIEEAEQRIEQANSHLEKIYSEDMIKKEATQTSTDTNEVEGISTEEEQTEKEAEKEVNFILVKEEDTNNQEDIDNLDEEDKSIDE